jgi:hypothetical protein
VGTGIVGFIYPGGGSQILTVSPLTLAANTPYFMAGSFSIVGGTGTANLVVKELLTGKTGTSTASAATTGPLTPNGTYMVGNAPAGFEEIHGSLAAVMFSTAFLSQNALAQWASDPWRFWYPNK